MLISEIAKRSKAGLPLTPEEVAAYDLWHEKKSEYQREWREKNKDYQRVVHEEKSRLADGGEPMTAKRTSL
ncbi:MAG: hypothetical protein FWG10_13875 [Eubacteriaceae bacterium]|nr:hypothetical protein [Eubacteriaceae bacterium]